LDGSSGIVSILIRDKRDTLGPSGAVIAQVKLGHGTDFFEEFLAQRENDGYNGQLYSRGAYL